ncbi:hypothetical protein K438DRAFT_1849593 [Mycena galopus ATCC 62051]|nr:hypothetical protein K438DRAFT_1849593 [Mycena galopus ATCC 62051]
MSQIGLSGPVGVCVLRCLFFLILSLPSPFLFSFILIFPQGRRRLGKRWARRRGRGRGLLVSYAATGSACANTILRTAAHSGR